MKNRLVVSSQYNGAMMLEFRPREAEPTVLWNASASSAPERQWKKAGFNTTMSTVLLLDGHVYVRNNHEIVCMSLAAQSHPLGGEGNRNQEPTP